MTDETLKYIRKYYPHVSSDKILSLSQEHAVLPFTYKIVKKLYEEYHIPEADTFKLYRQYHMLTAQQNMLLSAELLRLRDIFHKNGIQPLSFKGPLLAQTLYSDITQRQFGDLDILIEEQQREKAAHCPYG